MKTMRLLWVLFFLPVLLAGCKDDGNKDFPLSGGLVSEERTFRVNSNEHLLRVAVRAGGKWRVEGDMSWCTMERYIGTSSDSLLIYVQVNLSEGPREVVWQVKEGKETAEVRIYQEGASGEYHYRLPLVFHILGDSEVSDDEALEDGLLEMLKRANALFGGENRGHIDVNLEFVPAATDPRGRVLERSGIHWQFHYDHKNMMLEDFVANRYGDAEELWDPNRYINVYVSPEMVSGALLCGGYVFHPLTPSDHALPGLSSDDRYYRQLPEDFLPCIVITTAYLSDNYFEENVQRFINYLGGYLGLMNVYSGLHEGVADDFCDDTPHYNWSQYVKWRSTLEKPLSWEEKIQRIDMQGHIFISTNIMDYYWEGEYDEITPGQRKRIRHVLTYSPLIPGPKISLKLPEESEK